MDKKPIVFFDLETTGKNINYDKVLNLDLYNKWYCYKK